MGAIGDNDGIYMYMETCRHGILHKFTNMYVQTIVQVLVTQYLLWGQLFQY